MEDAMECEECGDDCYRESVDVGVGIIYGPWGCPSCGWSESSIYAHPQHKGFDQYGSYHPMLDPTGEGWTEHQQWLDKHMATL
jgi:hypothetical protein